MKFTSVNFIEEFLQVIYTRGASEKTIDGYRKDLYSFARWYEDTNGREPVPADVTSIDLREYQGYLQTIRGLKPASVNRYLTGVRRWLTWAKEAGHIDRLPSFPRQVTQTESSTEGPGAKRAEPAIAGSGT